jgi:hypothetical protein
MKVTVNLPPQTPPITRAQGGSTGVDATAGIEPSATACDGLTGLAQQMCYAVTYGV